MIICCMTNLMDNHIFVLNNIIARYLVLFHFLSFLTLNGLNFIGKNKILMAPCSLLNLQNILILYINPLHLVSIIIKFILHSDECWNMKHSIKYCLQLLKFPIWQFNITLNKDWAS